MSTSTVQTLEPDVDIRNALKHAKNRNRMSTSAVQTPEPDVDIRNALKQAKKWNQMSTSTIQTPEPNVDIRSYNQYSKITDVGDYFNNRKTVNQQHAYLSGI